MDNSTSITITVETLTPHEKAASVTWLIATGADFSTSDIAERLGMSWHGALYLMNGISRVIPITHERGRWRRFDA